MRLKSPNFIAVLLRSDADDDLAAIRADHLPGDEIRLHMHRHHAIEIGLADLRRRRAMPVPRIVDEDVNATEPLLDPGHDLGDASRFGDVCRHDEGAATELLDCRRRLLRALNVEVDDGDIGAALGHEQRVRTAHAAAGAGDERDAIVKDALYHRNLAYSFGMRSVSAASQPSQTGAPTSMTGTCRC